MKFEIWGETARLAFRKMSPEDFSEIAKIMHGENVQQIWEYYFSDDDIKNWIKKNLDLYNNYNLGYFLAIKKDSEEIVGQIALMPEVINGKNYYEIGYILKEEFTKQGFATEGAIFMADYAFNVLNLQEVIFVIRPENINSIKIAEKLGAVKSGSFIKYVNGKGMEHNIFVLKNFCYGS